MTKESKRFCHVIGTRPNTVKAAPVIREMASSSLDQLVVHTGQHYDSALSYEIEKDVGIEFVSKRFALEEKTQALQVGEISDKLITYFLENEVTDVIVYGDVSSTLAGALAAKYLNLNLIHVEAGLRSGDKSMPEEINRILVDSISDILFMTTREAFDSVGKLNAGPQKSHFVGNTMIDSLFFVRQKLSETDVGTKIDKKGLVTLHRQSNVDDFTRLGKIVEMLNEVSESTQLIFPVHPRTKLRLENYKLISELNTVSIELVEPLSYVNFVKQMAHSKFVITDSGGIQEEAAALGVPTYILRESTEREIAISSGRAILVSPESVLKFGLPQVSGSSRPIELWDGRAARRIAAILA